jgi:hypothetical protein
MPGEWLLQTAAGSTVGKLVLQLGRHSASRRSTSYARRAAVEELLELGGTEVISTEDEDLVDRGSEIAGDEGVRRAIDCVARQVGVANGIEVARFAAALVAHRREQRDRGGHVPHPMLASALEFHAFQLSGAFSHCGGDQDLAARSRRRDTCGEVDGRTEPVPAAGDRWAMMHPDADSWEAVTGDHFVRGHQAKCNRSGRVAVADHHRVADRLDHLAAAGPRDLGDFAAEGGGELGRVGSPCASVSAV